MDFAENNNIFQLFFHIFQHIALFFSLWYRLPVAGDKPSLLSHLATKIVSKYEHLDKQAINAS